MKNMPMTGEFSLLAYGSLTPDELFAKAIGTFPVEGKANLSGKKTFMSIIMPDKMTVHDFLAGIRSKKPPIGFEEMHSVYWNPNGPAIGLLLDAAKRTIIFADAGMEIPHNAVLFVGTNFVHGSSKPQQPGSPV